MADFPDFTGRVVRRGDSNYDQSRDQYAASSHEPQVMPAVIIYAADDSDVKKAINYAREAKLALSVRTGGHQYSAASSTYDSNIQLDLSGTYSDFTWDNEDNTLVTFGVSRTVGDFNSTLGSKSRFVPHGQCKYVTIGGHVQTGGYGQLGRSFGLFSDYVQKFRLFTADGEVQWVERGQELFWAVLGGSPGNFGVITHIQLQVFRDEDYPNSIGFRLVLPWNRHLFKKLLDIMVDVARDESFPRDFDYCVTVASRQDGDRDLPPNLRDGEGWPEDRIVFPWSAGILVFVQWVGFENSQEYNPTLVNRIKEVVRAGNEEHKIPVDDRLHTPMSVLTSHWIIPIKREFPLPYMKRTYASNSTGGRLQENGWTEWASERIEYLLANLDLCKVSAQFQHFGGKNSQFYVHGQQNQNITSFSWRDTRLGCTMDAFHRDEPAGLQQATAWVEENDREVGTPESKFCEDDHRVLWGSYDLDLAANARFYYDNSPELKYERLVELKYEHDPNGVFTPNLFCIRQLILPGTLD